MGNPFTEVVLHFTSFRKTVEFILNIAHTHCWMTLKDKPSNEFTIKKM